MALSQFTSDFFVLCPVDGLSHLYFSTLFFMQLETTRHFHFLKKFKMANLRCFLCQNWTFLLINRHSVQLGFPNFQRCCIGVISYFQCIFCAVTSFSRFAEVIKGHIFLNFTLQLIQVFMNTFVMMYNRHIGTNKQCVTYKGQVVTSKRSL